MIILYSLPTCPRCQILKEKLTAANLNYALIDDRDELIAANIEAVPIMEIDGERYEYLEALKYLKGIGGNNVNSTH